MELVRLIAILFIVLSIAARLGAQDTPTLKKCDHVSDSKTRFDAMRVLPPSKIYYDGTTITANYREGTDILSVDKSTILHIPNDYRSKLFWVLYSTCDKHVYVVDEVLPKQVKK